VTDKEATKTREHGQELGGDADAGGAWAAETQCGYALLKLLAEAGMGRPGTLISAAAPGSQDAGSWNVMSRPRRYYVISSDLPRLKSEWEGMVAAMNRMLK
jgi:hypothetical protein